MSGAGAPALSVDGSGSTSRSRGGVLAHRRDGRTPRRRDADPRPLPASAMSR